MVITIKKIASAAIFLAVFSFIYALSVQTANAQLCDESGLAGGITVVGYNGCAIPERDWKDPKNPGTANAPCVVSGTLGGSVTAFCSATRPCCEVAGFSSAKGAAGGIIGQLLQQVLGKLLGGGGGGGGSESGYQPPLFANSTGGGFLDIDSNLLGSDDLGLGDLIFGGDKTTDTTNTTSTTDTNNDTDTGTPGTGNNDAPGQEGDTVTTTYENLEGDDTTTTSGGSNNTGGDGVEDFFGDGSDFDDDFFGADFNDGDGSIAAGGISKELLEAQGLLEAARLESINKEKNGSLAVSYESLTPAEIRSLQDYNSSAVAVSGNLSPFNNDDAAQEEKEGAFKRFFRLLATLLGFGPPPTN